MRHRRPVVHRSFSGSLINYRRVVLGPTNRGQRLSKVVLDAPIELSRQLIYDGVQIFKEFSFGRTFSATQYNDE